MMKLKMTYKLAMSAGQDAGNRSMKRAKRQRWNDADYAAAAREFERLTGKQEDKQ
jgi:hypothetical protein